METLNLTKKQSKLLFTSKGHLKVCYQKAIYVVNMSSNGKVYTDKWGGQS